MSLLDIELPYSVIAEIYKNTLVAVIDKSPEPIQYLGKNLQKVLILVNYTDEAFLPGVQLDFLEKILSACKLNLGDIAIVNTAKQPRSFDDYVKEFIPASILTFGSITAIQDKFPEVTAFTPVSQQEIVLMSAPALDKLNEESKEGKQLKTRYWHSLKQFFGI